MAHPDPIKVLVRHDDTLWQAGVIASLSCFSDLQVLDPAEASCEPGRCEADVAVTDYGRGMLLASAASRPPARERDLKVLVVTTSDRECEIRAALARGVHGYLLAGCAPDELVCAVRAVHRGERFLSPKVATRLAENIASDPLTSREEAVLRLLVDGLCNKSIAERLGIEVGTVKSHLRSMFGKLQVNSRTQAVTLVERRGLLATPGQTFVESRRSAFGR